MIMYKVKVQISSNVGSFTCFVKCDFSDINVFFSDTVLSFREFSQFVSPRTASRYHSYFACPVRCKVLKVVLA